VLVQQGTSFSWPLPRPRIPAADCPCKEAGGPHDTYPQKGECPSKVTLQIPDITTYLLHKERKGTSPNTIDTLKKHLISLAQRTDLKNTTEVELAIARYLKHDKKPATNNYKKHLCSTYNGYCTHYKIQWEKPHYTEEPHAIQPPSQDKCTMFVASAHGQLSLKIDISIQTGLRPIEIVGQKGITANDIHPDQNTITARITKGCNQRPPLKITPELTARLQAHITRHNIKPTTPLFNCTAKTYSCHFWRLKQTLAKKLNDPTILSIRLYDLRHYYITKQLRKCQNAEIVRHLVGHKRLDTTQKYLHLLSDQSGEWTTEGTTDTKRAKELLDNDFTYQLTTPDGTMLFRKRK
jgi:integrase